jgi:sugar O-acyltransferase (sialic acid O-acetyltransferase NeuD family)
MKTEKRRLYIVGAGGYGREIASYLSDFSEDEKGWDFKGFIDDNVDALLGIESPNKIIDSINNFRFNKEDYVIVAIGNIEIKKYIVLRLINRVTFYTFVAKNSYIGNNVKLGKGVIICPGVKLPANISIGDFVTINIDSRIGHDSIIDDNCSIMPNVDIGGESVIGKNVFLGTKSTIIPGIKIESDNYIGVAAVILKDIITTEGTYFGNPARRMK